MGFGLPDDYGLGASANSPIDWTGNRVPDDQQYYSPMMQLIDGVRHASLVLNPNYKGPASSGNGRGVSPAPIPPHLIFTFDTIGQTIFRMIGHCRLPLRIIWAKGINESGDALDATTITFAAAIGAPIDPLEEGVIFGVWDGGAQVFNSGGVVTPAGWSPEDAAALAASLASVVIYPGDEAQLPAALIVADKGADKTNAFRGLRYIIFQNYPARGGGGGVPQLSLGWQRTNDGGKPKEESFGGVEFLPGIT